MFCSDTYAHPCVCFAVGMDFTPQEASSFRHSIFSPLQSKHTILASTDSATTAPEMERVESTDGQHSGSSPHNQSSLTPLTISARDIEGGSMDFTVGSLSFSGSDVLKRTTPKNTGKAPVGKPPTPIVPERGDFITPPRGTSLPSAPVRVRVSASKLREIQSPHSSISGRSASVISVGHVSDVSSFQRQDTTPRALSPPPMEIRNSKSRVSVSGTCRYQDCIIKIIGLRIVS